MGIFYTPTPVTFMVRKKIKTPKIGDRQYLTSTKEDIQLIEPKGDVITYIEDNFEFDDDDPRESNPIVKAKQRWVVDVVTPDLGGKSKYFRCMRTLTWDLGNYYRIITVGGVDQIIRRIIT